MPPTFVQSLLQRATANATITLSGSKVVTLGNTIFVAFGGDPTTVNSVTDNLGNTYTSLGRSGPTAGALACCAELFRADVTKPGTLTTITIQKSTSNVGCAIALEFSGVGAVRSSGSTPAQSFNVASAFPGPDTGNVADYVANDLWIGAFAQESSNAFSPVTADPAVAALEPTAEQISGSGTSGVSAGCLYYISGTGGTGKRLTGQWTSASYSLGVGVAVQPAAVPIVYNDAPSGTLSLSGSCVDTWVKRFVNNDAPAGSIVLAGTCVDSWGKGTGYTDAPSGGIALTGSCADSWRPPIVYTDAAAGSISLTGSVIDSNHVGKVDAPVGTIVLNGGTVAESFREAVLAGNPISYWRLGESAGPTAVDETGTHPGTYAGTPQYGAAGSLEGDANTAVGFSGDDSVSTPNHADFDFDTTTAFSIECWVRTTKYASQPLISKRASSGESGWEVYAASGGFHFDFGGIAIGKSSSDNWSDGVWHHLVITKSISTLPSAIRMYVDGAEIKTSKSAVAGSPRYPTALVFGKSLRTSSTFVGDLDEVAIYPGVLSPSDVKNHYIAGAGLPVSYSDSCSGSMAIGGAATTRHIFKDAPVGRLTVAGTAIESGAHRATVSGAVKFGGSRTENFDRVSAPTGAVRLAGTCVDRWGWTWGDSPTGFIDVVGSATDKYSRKYIDKPVGRIVAGGSVEQSLRRSSAPAGVVKFTGVTAEGLICEDISSGSLAVSGTSEDDYSIVIGDDKPFGRLRFSGLASMVSDFTDESAGVYALGGRASDAYRSGNAVDYNDSVTGDMRLWGRSLSLRVPGFSSTTGRIVLTDRGRIVTRQDGRVLTRTTGRKVKA